MFKTKTAHSASKNRFAAHGAPTDPPRYEQALLSLVLVLVCVFLVYSGAAKRLDLIAYDSALTFIDAPASDDIVIVAVDEKSLASIGQWPWRRAIHAQLVDKLTRYNAALIGFDVLFAEPDANFPNDDEIFAQAIYSSGKVVLPMHIHPLNYGNSMTEILPIATYVEAARALGHVHVEVDTDGVARGIFLKSGVGEDYWPALSMALASEINPLIQYQSDRANELFAPYLTVRSDYRLIPFAHPHESYARYSYLDVMADKVPSEVFRDKVVLVGASAVGLGDTIPTPVTSRDTPISGVEFHANAYSAIMQQNVISHIQDDWAKLLTFAFIMVPILLFPRLSPSLALPATLALIALIAGFSYLLLRYDHTWFAPVNAILGVSLAYPFWSWQRLRHLNRFFAMELERLDTEQDLSFRALGQLPEEQVFLSLLALLKPNQYLFKVNKQERHSLGAEHFSSINQYQRQQWRHNKNSSWLELAHNKQITRIALRWNDLDSEAQRERRKTIIDYLNKLDFSQRNAKKPRRQYEQVSRRISQVRHAIRSMQDMRTFISKGFEQVPDAIIVCDSIGSIIYSNSQAWKWLESSADKLQTRSLISCIGPLLDDTQPIETLVNDVLLAGQERDLEISLGKRQVRVQGLPFQVDTDSDAGMMLCLSDISQIRQQQREKNLLIDFLSHDLRSPLVSQMAMLEGLRSGRISWQPALIDQLEHHSRRSLNLSEQFLQLNRAEQLNTDDFYEFELLNNLENAVDTLHAQAQAKHITIDLEVEEDLWLLGNAELIERALTNLLGNAIKYSPEQSRIEVRSERHAESLSLYIQDQGYGIAEDELPYIFDRFRRQKSSEIKGEKGAGLGLSFVKTVADKHNIKLELSSTVNVGTRVSLHFPLPPEPEPEQASQQEPAPQQ